MLFSGIDKILQFYNHVDIYIKMIHADNEFRSILHELLDKWDVDINFCNPGEHVPHIERENRTQQERFRVNSYWLPFKIIPRNMVRYLNLRIAKNRALLPEKNGISHYYSPHIILNQRQVDYEREFKHSFGNYVQAYEENFPKNNTIPQLSAASISGRMTHAKEGTR